MNQQTPPAKQPKQSRPGILSGGIFMLFKMALISLASWFVLTAWFMGECFIKGPEFALAQAQGIVNLNVNFIEQNQSSWAKHVIAWFYSCHEKFMNLAHKWDFLRLSFLQTAGNLLLMTTEIDLSRLFIFLLAMPLLALCLFIGITDGLVKRDIRKFQGARESTFTFHRSKHLMQFCFFLPFFIYLSLPIAITPLVILVTQGILLGAVVWLSTAYFKKYL